MSWIVRALSAGAFVLVLLAGCGEQSAMKTTEPPAPRAREAVCYMPSYPILLVDLPRLQAGRPVRPAYSYPYRRLQLDLDSPPATVRRRGAKPPMAVDVSLVP